MASKIRPILSVYSAGSVRRFPRAKRRVTADAGDETEMAHQIGRAGLTARSDEPRSALDRTTFRLQRRWPVEPKAS